MTIRHRMSVTAVGALVTLLAAPASAEPSSVSHRYRGGISHYPICTVDPSFGGACFLPPPGARSVSVTVRDDLGVPVGGVVQIVVNEDLFAEVPFCVTASDVALPAGIEGVNVALRPTCGAVGTTGTVSALFG